MEKKTSLSPILRAMRKWFLLITAAIIVTEILASYDIRIVSNQQIIHLKDNTTFLVDRITGTNATFVFYEADGKSGMVMKSDVVSTQRTQVEKKASVLDIIDQQKEDLLIQAGAPEIVATILQTDLLVFLILLTLFSLAAKNGNRLFSRFSKKSRPYRSPKPSSPSKLPAFSKQIDTPSAPVLSTEDSISSDIRDIILFFLRLHQVESGLPESAPTRFSKVSDTSIRRMKTFELEVKGNREWFTRRMSISPLGEDTGSKSKCFYVIYDRYLVVKIPPTPVTDITKYMDSIRREVEIAAQLAPVDCIVPSISIILKRLKQMPYETELTAEQIEKQYLRLIKDKPEFQSYLQVGGKFTLFMELSNDYFVSTVIDDLHAINTGIRDTIRNDLDLAWDQTAFTSRYGLAALSVFEKIQNIYHICRKAVPQILQKMEGPKMVSPHAYQIKNWFLMSISGKERPEDQDSVDPVFLKAIKTEFSDIFKKNQESVKIILRFLRLQREIQNFSKKQRAIANIVAKMLGLLHTLGEKKVALRDLKPDNLFISSTSTNYPAFLNDVEQFEIGVIDVETAVTLKPEKDGTIAQPLLGGTPLYATPLHILKNDAIAEFFGDTRKMLHYEDWFAMIGIIFRAICGKNLFFQTAKSFPGILKMLKSGQSAKRPDEATVKAMSRKFWSTAKADLKTQLTAYAHLLEQLVVHVPPQLVKAIEDVLVKERSSIQETLHNQIRTTPLLKNDKNKDFLLNASQSTVTKQIERWRYQRELPESQRPIADQMLAFLNDLQKLKQKEAEKNETLAALAVFPHPLRSDALLKALFQIVHQNMYPSRWHSASEK